MSPCGWYLPITSPTTRADFTCLEVDDSRISFIANRMRRCTGLSPSSTCGSARDFTTLIA